MLNKLQLNITEERFKNIKEEFGNAKFNMSNKKDVRIFVTVLNKLFKNLNFDYLLEDNYLTNIFENNFGKDTILPLSVLIENIESEISNDTIRYKA